jgi:spermidine synthase
MKKITSTELDARVAEIIRTRFPEGTFVTDRRIDVEGDGWFVVLDDPTDEFEFVEIFVNHDGSWEA